MELARLMDQAERREAEIRHSDNLGLWCATPVPLS